MPKKTQKKQPQVDDNLKLLKKIDPQMAEVIKVLKQRGYMLIKKDLVLELIEQADDFKTNGNIVTEDEENFLSTLGGLNGDELEILATNCQEQSQFYEEVAKYEDGRDKVRSLDIAAFQKRRARVFSEWAALEEKNFESWQKENKSKTRRESNDD